jgi:DMSO/TMAO reductase YedYZ heme-binding membrane subunit
MGQLGSHWTDFHEIWYLWIFLQSFANIHVSLKSDKNSRYRMLPADRRMYNMTTRRLLLLRMRNFSDKFCGENQTGVLYSLIFYERPAVCDVMCEITVQPDRPYDTEHKSCNLHAG